MQNDGAEVDKYSNKNVSTRSGDRLMSDLQTGPQTLASFCCPDPRDDILINVDMTPTKI